MAPTSELMTGGRAARGGALGSINSAVPHGQGEAFRVGQSCNEEGDTISQHGVALPGTERRAAKQGQEPGSKGRLHRLP